MALLNRSALALTLAVSFSSLACGGDEGPADRPDAGSGNTAPVAVDASVVTAEDTVFEGTLTATDADGDVLSYALVVGPVHGVITVQSAGGFTYTPSENYAGPDTFTFVASDGTDPSNAGRVSITVTPVNDPPVITGQLPVSIDEDVALSVTLDVLTVVDPDSDPEGHTVQILPATADEYTVDEAGRVVPPLGYFGSLQVRLTVTDEEGAVSEPFILAVTVVAVDDPPTLVPADPPLQTLEDVALLIGADDLEIIDVDSVEVTFKVVDGVDYTHDGANRVTPAVNFHGDLLVNVVLDDGVNSVPASVLVRVVPVDDPPVITGLVAPLSTGEETPLTLSVSHFAIDDPDTSPEAFVLRVLEGDGYTVDASGHTLTPDEGVLGSLTVSVTVSDATSTSAAFTFPVGVVYVNRPPTLISQRTIRIDEDTPYQVLPSDFDVTDPDHTFPDEHFVTLLPGDGYSVDADDLSGSTFIPAQDFHGQLIVFGLLQDLAGGAAHFELEVTVDPINDPPVINPDHLPLEVDEDHTLVVTLSDLDVTDVDDEGYPTGFTLQLVDDEDDNHYTLAGDPLAVVPDPDFAGELWVTVIISDPDGASVTGEVPVIVRAIDDPPLLSALEDAAIVEDGVYGPVALVVTDIDTPLEALIVTATSGNTILVPDANVVVGGTGGERTLTVTPAQDQSGEAVITVTVSDGTTVVSDAFVLTVGADNDAPSIDLIADQIIEEDESTELLVTIDDVDTPVDLLILSAVSNNQTLLPASGLVVGGAGALRTLRITPAANQTGSALVTVTVSDGSLSSSVQFTVTVTEVNDAPTVSAFVDLVTQEDTATGPIEFLVGDVETAPGDLVLSAASSNPTLVPVGNILFGGAGAQRTVTLTPAADQHGTTLITVTVSDGVALASESFTLTVQPVDDAPVISVLSDVVIDEDTSTGPIAFVLADVDTNLTELVVMASSSNQSLVPDASLVLAGVGADRILTATPAQDRFGTAVITVSVSDGTTTVTRSFTLTVRSVNDLPTLSVPADRTIAEDTSTGPLAFMVNDVETASAQLTVTASSSNEALVPVANIVIQRASNTVTVTPASNAFGQATITLTVTDADGGSTSASFVLTVTPVNDAPAITTIGDVSILEDAVAGPLTFTVGDVETSAASLTVSATSNNPTLVPTANVALGGSGASRTVTVTPAANQYGSALITVKVSDGSAEASTSFVVNVTAVNDPPRVEGHALLKTHAGTPLELSITDLTVTDNPGAPGENNAPFTLQVLSGTNYSVNGRIITPSAGFVGTLTVNVRVTDSGTPAASTTSTLSVVVYDYIKDDTFTTPGNTVITQMQVRANDPNPTLPITSFTAATVPAGGTVSRTLDVFTAEPPVGLGRSSFTFTYTVEDADGFSDTATVTVHTTDLIWYVDSARTTHGIGTFSSPFKTLAPAAVASNTGHVGQTIYVYSGSYADSASLSNGQQLIGRGVAFSPTPNPAGSGVFLPAGTSPTLGGALTLSGGAGPFEVAGVNLVNSPANAVTATLSNVDLTIRKVNISQHAGRGLSVTNGRKLTVTDLAISSPDANSGHGIFVSNMSDKVLFEGSNSVTSHGGSSLYVDGAGSIEAAFTSLTSTGGPNGVVVANTTGSVVVATSVTASDPTGTGLVLTNVGTAQSPFTFTISGTFTHSGGERGVDVKNHLSGAITLGKEAASAGQGVSLSNTTAQGIRLNRATNVRLNGLSITNSGDDGLQIVDAALAGGAPTVNGLSIINATLTNTGNALGEWGIDLGSGVPSTAQVTGEVLLNNVKISQPGDGGVRLENAGGAISSASPVTFDKLTVENGGEDGHGVLLRATGTATMYVKMLTPTVTHTHATRMNYAGDGINAAVAGNNGARLDLVVSGGTFRNTAFASFPSRGDNAIRLEADGVNTTLGFDVANNTIEGWTGHSVSVDVGGSGNVSAEGFVRGNLIGTSSRSLSGSEVGSGINLLFDGDANLPAFASMQAKIEISGNTIHNAGLSGIQVYGRDATAPAQRLDLILETNKVFGTGVVYGYDVRTLTSTPQNQMTLCARVGNNEFTGSSTSGYATRLAVTSGASFLLPGFAGGPGDVPAYLFSRGHQGTTSATAGAGASFTAGTCNAPATR